MSSPQRRASRHNIGNSVKVKTVSFKDASPANQNIDLGAEHNQLLGVTLLSAATAGGTTTTFAITDDPYGGDPQGFVSALASKGAYVMGHLNHTYEGMVHVPAYSIQCGRRVNIAISTQGQLLGCVVQLFYKAML